MRPDELQQKTRCVLPKTVLTGMAVQPYNHMKRLLILPAFAFITFSCTHLKYLERFEGYKGKPNIVESTTYNVSRKGDSTEEEVAYKSVLYFDKKGRMVRKLNYKSDGGLSNGGWNYVYDRMGNMVQNTLYKLDSSVMVRNNYTYNKYGQIIRREHALGKANTITRTTFDRSRRLAVIEGYRNDSIFHEKSVITYDDNWKEKEIKSFNQSGKLKTRIEKKYDKNGNQILSRWYDSSNHLYEFYKVSFNNNNNRIRIEKHKVKGTDTTLIETTKIEYMYDDKGNIIYEGLVSNDRTTWITRNRYYY